MGPRSRYLGPLVPAEPLLWQDPVPAVDHELIGEQDIAALKAKILASGLSISQLVTTAWASASTFRGSDKRGGANGARIRLAPQKDWEVNQPAELAKVLPKLEAIQKDFNSAQSGVQEEGLACRPDRSGRLRSRRGSCEKGRPRREGSLLAGAHGRVAGADRCALVRGHGADRGRVPQLLRKGHEGSAAELLLDRANLLTLTAPEMTVLIGGMRALNANFGQSKHGVFTSRPETLTNDFFVNLLDMNTAWQKSATSEGVLEGHDRATGEIKWTGTVVDLVFGSNSQLRALAEVYACSDSKQTFVKDFVAAWNKVMNLDRFDLA
jgi:catalase-peroxidase